MPNRYIYLRIRIIWLMLKRGKISFKKVLNLLHCYGAYFLRMKKTAPSPYLISFELWNECNESCVFCRDENDDIFNLNPSGPEHDHPVPKGKLPFETYAGVLSQVQDRLAMAIPYVNGEPLLSKDVYKAIQYATDLRICTLIATNGILMNEANCEKLLRAGLDLIKIHISGFTQSVHSIQHRKGDVELIKRNIRNLVQKNREGNHELLIMLDYILYEHNKHEVQLAKDFCEDLGIMFNLRKGNPKGMEETEKTQFTGPLPVDIHCDWLWTTLTVDWDNSIYPCCDHVVWNDAESYEKFEEGITSIKHLWNGPKAVAMRTIHLTKGRTPIPICAECPKTGVTFKF
jgi:MoaA/NifB/PqqE/SkfB family radical SAM enzyme